LVETIGKILGTTSSSY